MDEYEIVMYNLGMTQPPSARILYVLWKQWVDGDNEAKRREDIQQLLEDILQYSTETYRVNKALRELHRLQFVAKEQVATGKPGTPPWGYRIVTDGSLVVWPTTAVMLLELRNFRPLPVEEQSLVGHLLRLGLTDKDRQLSEADIRTRVGNCCLSGYVKKDDQALLSPTQKLHTHAYYLSLVANHATKAHENAPHLVMDKTSAPADGAPDRSDGEDRDQSLLSILLPAVGKDRLERRDRKVFGDFLNSEIRPMSSADFHDWLDFVKTALISPAQQPAMDVHFKAGDVATIVNKLRATLSDFKNKRKTGV